MKYDVTYACGHEGEVELFGPSRVRQQKIRSIEKYELCPECAAKKRAEDAAKAAAENAANDLPALTGSEKQIAWAEQIRAQAVKAITEYADRQRTAPNAPENAIRALEIATQEIFANTSASFYINNRNDMLTVFNRACSEAFQALEAGEAAPVEEVFQNDPSKPGTLKVVVRRSAIGDTVSVVYPKDADLMDYVKSEGFMWRDGAWRRGPAEDYESVEDLAAATVNALIARGFAVSVRDEATKNLLHTGDWKSAPTRKIQTDGEEFIIEFEDGNEELKRMARSLPGARPRYRGGVAVPFAMADAVADFADSFGFKVYDDAQKQFDAASEAVTVQFTPREEREDFSEIDEKTLRKEEDLSDLIDEN